MVDCAGDEHQGVAEGTAAAGGKGTPCLPRLGGRSASHPHSHLLRFAENAAPGGRQAAGHQTESPAGRRTEPLRHGSSPQAQNKCQRRLREAAGGTAAHARGAAPAAHWRSRPPYCCSFACMPAEYKSGHESSRGQGHNWCVRGIGPRFLMPAAAFRRAQWHRTPLTPAPPRLLPAAAAPLGSG